MTRTLLEAAAHWDALAREQDEFKDVTSAAKAEVYRRTAESLRMEEKDGIARCVCHLKPFGKPADICR